MPMLQASHSALTSVLRRLVKSEHPHLDLIRLREFRWYKRTLEEFVRTSATFVNFNSKVNGRARRSSVHLFDAIESLLSDHLGHRNANAIAVRFIELLSGQQGLCQRNLLLDPLAMELRTFRYSIGSQVARYSNVDESWKQLLGADDGIAFVSTSRAWSKAITTPRKELATNRHVPKALAHMVIDISNLTSPLVKSVAADSIPFSHFAWLIFKLLGTKTDKSNLDYERFTAGLRERDHRSVATAIAGRLQCR